MSGTIREHRSIGKEISTISRYLALIIDREMAHLGLSAATIPVLTFLYDNEGLHQDILAQALHFDKSSATRAVARLVRQGYVTKTVDPANRRRNIIRTTVKAQAIREEILGQLRQLTADLFADFSTEERQQYFALTERIHLRTIQKLRETP